MEAFENILECYTHNSTLVLKGFSAESSAWLEYALPAAESSFRFYYAFHICFQREMRKNLRRMIVRLAQGCECGAVTEDEQSIAVEYVGSSWQQVVNCAGVLLQGVFLRLLPAQCGVGVADEAANIMGDRLQPRCYRTA